MTIEPHNVRFQIGAIVMPHEVKTAQDYRAAMRAKYGKIPSLAALAAMENKTTGGKISTESDATLEIIQSERLKSLKAAAKLKVIATRNRIIACLTKPKTAAELAEDVGLSRQSICAHMRAAYTEGLVTRKMVKHITIWGKP